jgi:hypothetical protein
MLHTGEHGGQCESHRMNLLQDDQARAESAQPWSGEEVEGTTGTDREGLGDKGSFTELGDTAAFTG